MERDRLRKVYNNAMRRRSELIKRTRFLFECAKRNRRIQAIVEGMKAYQEIKSLPAEDRLENPKSKEALNGINIFKEELNNPFWGGNPEKLLLVIGDLYSAKSDARLYALGLRLGLQNIELVLGRTKAVKAESLPVDFLENLLPSSDPFGLATSFLPSPEEYGHFGIVGFDEEEKTITLKIRMDRNIQDIQQDVADLYDIIHKEARISGYPLKRTKKRKTRDSETVFDKYDLYIRVYDSIEKEGKTATIVAKEIFKEEFQDPFKVKETDPVPDPDRARKKVENYYKEAKKLIDGGFWSI